MDENRSLLEKSTSWMKILPVMFGFFIMGFVDMIGISINYVKEDFSLSDTSVNLISLSCYLWFLLLSVPTGMLMSIIGRKKTVLLSFIFTIIAMCIPVLSYSFIGILVAFAFVGIGNTLLQVSLNPLVMDVVSANKLTGTLTLGQFVKAIASFLGPILASWFAAFMFGWKLLFPVYAVVTLFALIWLFLSPIQEPIQEPKKVSINNTLDLFKDKYIVAFFIGILVLVGADVGINTTLPKLIMERCGLQLKEAGLGDSLYFLMRTIGALFGGIVLMKYSPYKFFVASVILAFAGLGIMIFSKTLVFILISVSLFGLGYSNLFAIIFSYAMQRFPLKSDEISALLIVGIFGGAILPPLLGIVSDLAHTQEAAIICVFVVWIYVVWMIRILKNSLVK